jgi:hypothetical protein
LECLSFSYWPIFVIVCYFNFHEINEIGRLLKYLLTSGPSSFVKCLQVFLPIFYEAVYSFLVNFRHSLYTFWISLLHFAAHTHYKCPQPCCLLCMKFYLYLQLYKVLQLLFCTVYVQLHLPPILPFLIFPIFFTLILITGIIFF